MFKKPKICVAMSGGVDSSVAATLLAKEYGKQNVIGVTMRLFCYGKVLTTEKSCCSLAAINDAKLVCTKLGIKHYVLDVEKDFEKSVVQNFVSEYLSGRTPNPCVRCNQFIKFDYLLEKAKKLEANFLATGHYVRRFAPTQINADQKNYSSSEVEKPSSQNEKFSTRFTESNNILYKLLKGIDERKDQSYFLYTVTQGQLRHLLFPLGDYKKEEVRKIAKELGLKTAGKVESQEICFIPDNDYPTFLRKRLDKVEVKEGPILNKKGNKLETHLGLPFYTIGQRRGLKISSKEPLYVIKIDTENNNLVVGTEQDLYSNELVASDINWVSGSKPKLPLKCKAKIRYNMPEEDAIVSCQLSVVSCRIVFDKPVRAITPGQSIVFYKSDEVLGGGIIEVSARGGSV